MPAHEAPSVELGNAPQTPSLGESPSLSEVSSASSPEPHTIRATPLFRALAMPPPEPDQPPGQDELERRLPGYRRIVIPRELTLIELLKQSSGVQSDEEVLHIREAKLRVVAERVGLRRLHVLAPRLRSLTLDGSAITSLRDLGIGLAHLKVLSVSRCGLTCLDGVWGLGALCELYAAGNRLQDLQPLAALQKLHTLNLADNPIPDTNRIWTLGVCSSLRRLVLSGTPAASTAHYRARVASSLPMLVYLDDLPLHVDIDYDTDCMSGVYSSDSENSDAEEPELMLPPAEAPPGEPEPGPSTQFPMAPTSVVQDHGDSIEKEVSVVRLSHRPATTEGAGARPPKPTMQPRPHTAKEKSTIRPPSQLQILNTLMELETEKELVTQAMEEASRALADEIPRAPKLEDWARFREETGIEINIDFNERSRDADPTAVLERLEKIERETRERLRQEESGETSTAPNHAFISMPMQNEYDIWSAMRLEQLTQPTLSVDTLFQNIGNIDSTNLNSY